MDWHKCGQSFIQIVEDQSFTKAATNLYTSSSSLSKHINWLEEQLGVQLLQRTTRKLDLTVEGEYFYEQAKLLLNDWEDLKEKVRSQSNEPRGILTIGISVIFSNLYIAPLLPSLLALYPELKINVRTLTYPLLHNVDHLDLYFSHKSPDFFSVNMDHHVIGQAYLKMFASPDYLLKNGTPKTLEDLSTHNCLMSTGSDSPHAWEFEKGGSIQVTGNFMSDNSSTLVKAAVAGLGIVFTSPLAFNDELEGALVPVLPEHHSRAWTIYAYYPKLKTLPFKTQSFLNYVEDKLRSALK
ncbi:LysR family transcriptional regulator [Shewanella surugensis]|uniref:LysR family transcriptional regulator n=1 Tax=Shewanella surugensis TaxID=212020 RepID=A0ABT0L9V2_9GAMM|nr:LysR family transcriptional regulator [Shewanella surugensis]MCL1124466.1 LysR family transcriptional regulator [Shewanella surugensis]